MTQFWLMVLPVAHYTGNETAFFERKHKADSALAFNREPDAFQPPKLLPGKELVAKLAEKARNPRRGEDDADKHPDDRDNNDNYVNEVPDLNEKDYKVPGR
ncbi:hypothetical protein Q1695_012137 [Nippostrongylus brasiliensis]|nr:hypothetical protein Q1695_012137 [Nippostrongylus brasiliensis]